MGRPRGRWSAAAAFVAVVVAIGSSGWWGADMARAVARAAGRGSRVLRPGRGAAAQPGPLTLRPGARARLGAFRSLTPVEPVGHRHGVGEPLRGRAATIPGGPVLGAAGRPGRAGR